MRKKLLIGIAAFFAISLLLLLFNDTRPVRFIQGMFQSIYQTPKAILYSASVQSNGQSEIEKLREQNIKYRERLVELENLRKDNIALRSQFEEESIESSKLLPAKVIGFQGGITNPEVLVIDKGNQDRIKIGQAVVVGKSLVGTISRVSDRYSSVNVLTNASFSTVAKTNSTNSIGVIRGAGDFLIFDNIAVTDDIKDGETVATRGAIEISNAGIPPDLVIGVVETVRKVESEPFQSARVTSQIDIAKLTRVFILL